MGSARPNRRNWTLSPSKPRLRSDRERWRLLVERGQAVRLQADHAAWELGDLAAQVITAYGARSLERFAEEIGVASSTLQERRRVAAAYEKSTRVDSLTWSHHRAVAASDDRLDWLARAAAERWSVRDLERELVTAHIAEFAATLPPVAPVVELREVLAEEVVDELEPLARGRRPGAALVAELAAIERSDERLRAAMHVAQHLEHSGGAWPTSLAAAAPPAMAATQPTRSAEPRHSDEGDQRSAQARLELERRLERVHEARLRLTPSDVHRLTARMASVDREELRAQITALRTWLAELDGAVAAPTELAS